MSNFERGIRSRIADAGMTGIRFSFDRGSIQLDEFGGKYHWMIYAFSNDDTLLESVDVKLLEDADITELYPSFDQLLAKLAENGHGN